MTSFQWKRKIGGNVCKVSAQKFALESEEKSVENGVDDVFIMQPAKKAKLIPLEDSSTKFKRLYDEGCILAENERYWEALKKWDEAQALDPTNEKLHELQSQVYLELQELIPAVKAAEKAVELKPTWWVAYQTLARAQMSLGEIELAIKNFSKSCHLNPEVKELWTDDLGWACSLLSKFKRDDEHCKSNVKLDVLRVWSESVVEKLKDSSDKSSHPLNSCATTLARVT